MRAVIAAAGKKCEWPSSLGGAAHMAPIQGQPLLQRTIQQVRRLTGDVHVTIPAGAAAYRGLEGATVHERHPWDGCSEYESTRGLWSETDRTVLLLGDVAWSDEALAVVASNPGKGYRGFGRQWGSVGSRCRYGEIYAASWWPEDAHVIDGALAVVQAEREADRRVSGRRVHPTGWMLLRGMQGTDLRVHECLAPWWVDIPRLLPGDPTDDVDFLDGYWRHQLVTPVLTPCPDEVTVSMPYHAASAPYLRRAVDAVLAQTHDRLRLVVTCDGPQDPSPWPLLADITDPRLTRFELPENRGRYYVDAVVLAACRTPWWTVHDSDDAAAPEWLASMLAVTDRVTTAVFTAQQETGVDGATATVHVEPIRPGRFVHLAHMAGLWRTVWLRSVYGPHPGYRVGWDSVMTAVPQMLRGAGVVTEPLYHRYRHTRSLTYSPDTGGACPLRTRTRAELRDLYPRVVEAALRGPAAVKALIASTVDPQVAASVHSDAAALAAHLASGGQP